MSETEIREPIQKRSIEKKEKIIESGFELICKDGYYKTNTSKIAKKAGVSTGIVYQYFKDKHDIFICGLEKYADDIFYPMLNMSSIKFETKSISTIIRNIIKKYISNHKLSLISHEEITAMIHSDKDVAYYFYKREMEMTNKIVETLIDNGFKINNIYEKVHIVIGLVDNLCHEIVYHKHKELNYAIMTDIVVNDIVNILTTQD
ncbi:MAG: TetR/AcrR family transcriptional regulator [Clostridia bacterium]|nr:TetR/AcrR family transcriptional regulator [Clostridia bacterium]